MVPELAYYVFYLTITQIVSALTCHKIANKKFQWLVYTELITILTTTSLVCFTGHTTFYGSLPDSIIKWMGNLRVATLRNFMTPCYVVVLLSIFCFSADTFLRQRKELKQ